MACTIYTVSTLLTFISMTNGSTITQIEALHGSLFNNYNRNLLINHEDMVKVKITAGIVSMKKYDEISGEISLAFTFNIEWVDERLKWIPTYYGGKTSMLVSVVDIWRPKLYVLQASKKIQEIGSSRMARIFHDGSIVWDTGNVLTVMCSLDVTYFPFDVQTCQITIGGMQYTKDELMLYTEKSELLDIYFSKNSQWHYVHGSVMNYTLGESFAQTVNITLTLNRRREFFLVYIITPMIILGIMNNLVFIVPVRCGERSSVAVTIFLSFVVYMKTINDNVPESSSPMAYIYYYILFLMAYSSTIIFLCIVSLQIYDNDRDISPCIQILTTYLKFQCNRRKAKIQNACISSRLDAETNIKGMDATKETKTKKLEENVCIEDNVTNKINKSEITWTVVGKSFDRYCFTCLSFIFWIVTISMFTFLKTAYEI